MGDRWVFIDRIREVRSSGGGGFDPEEGCLPIIVGLILACLAVWGYVRLFL